MTEIAPASPQAPAPALVEVGPLKTTAGEVTVIYGRVPGTKGFKIYWRDSHGSLEERGRVPCADSLRRVLNAWGYGQHEIVTA
jgi:hypothetical protein